MRVNSSRIKTVAAKCGTKYRRMSLFGRVAVSSALAIITMILIIPAGEATAGSGDQGRSGKHSLIDRQHLQDLKKKIAEMKDRVRHNQHNGGSGNGDDDYRGLQDQVTDLMSQVGTLSSVNTSLVTQLQAAVAEIALLQGRVTTLEQSSSGSSSSLTSLAKYVTVDTNPINGVKGPHVIFRGANVHIQSGSNMTDDGGLLRGLGNLFIGYNESPDPSIVYDGVGCDRTATGSHNLVLGKGNLVTSYGSTVLGSQNCVTGRQATILGGEVNEAHAQWSTVLGGNRSVTYDYNRIYSTLPRVP